MAHQDIVQNLIFQPGQSQAERTPVELDARHARVDERTPEDMLASVRALAAAVNYYAGSDPENPAGDWKPMFPDTGASLAEFRARSAGRVPAHLALYLAFLELYQAPREIANRITGRHMDFHYRDVLRLRKRGSTPDRAHVLLELKKGAAPVAITAADLFTAGKGASGAERIYAPVAATPGAETVVNASRVESLRSIYVDRRGAGTVRFAPVADSSNGVGGKLGPGDSGWRAFGYGGLPAAEVGFAVASPVLRMAEGQRRGTITLTLSADLGARLAAGALAGAFILYATGEKGWIELEAATVTSAAGNELVCAFTLAAGAPALVDHSPEVHGTAYPATAPVVQVLLRPGGDAAGYLSFEGVSVRSARVEVAVSGVTSLALESDQGGLNPKKPFQPFGPQPTTGARFMVGYPEALSKRLTLLTLSLTWKDAPTNFTARYFRYGVSPRVTNTTFKATVTLRDGEGTELVQSGVQLFGTSDATEPRVLSFQPGAGAAVGKRHAGSRIRGLRQSGTAWGERLAKESGRASPVAKAAAPPPVREGFVTLALEHGFLHAEYRKVYTETVVAFARAAEGATLALPAEPYTPTVQDISLGYHATSGTVAVSPGTVDDFADPDVQFFHRAPFGPMREHGYPREHLRFVGSTDVPLLPAFPYDGELLVGLTGVAAGDSVSLLFQAAPASADPDLPRQPVHWSVLCDNYWKTLDDGVAGDTTGGLLASGIVRLLIPAEATTTNTVLPAGCVWIRAAVARGVAAVSRLLAVASNAVEVEFIDNGDPAHLASALPPGSIARLRAGLAPVKAVTQPYASFGGALAEGDDAFRTRAAERIRHRGRCVTAWDYERAVLDAFPGVHRVKCIPHASDRSWMAPGHVMLVVVPDLRDRNDDDPLRPRVDADTLARIAAHVQARTAGQVRVRVKNPRFQKVRLDFQVRFLPGCDFNHCRETLQAELVRVLSPWAFDPDRPVSFGGSVYRSALLDFVEERPYVDYATEFQMYTFEGDTPAGGDVGEARPETPDTLLVSDQRHRIEPAP